MSDNPLRKLRYAMVGGGRDAFIGAVHRMAIALDGQADLVAGALSSSPDKAMASGRDLFLAEQRNHGDWQHLLEDELKRPAHERIDFVSIVTPNHVHFSVAQAFVEAGFHVVCDKPLVHTRAQADALVAAVARRGTVFGVTYNYTGYPMVRQARAMVRAGELGTIRKLVVEYNQGWLATQPEGSGNKQAGWRTDPADARLKLAARRGAARQPVAGRPSRRLYRGLCQCLRWRGRGHPRTPSRTVASAASAAKCTAW